MTASRQRLIVMMEIAILAALSMGLDFIDSSFRIGPYSFSFSMVPILILAIRRGVGAGVLGGLIWALLQMALGDAAAWFFHPVQVLLDYPLAFMALGLAGFARKNPTLTNIIIFSTLAVFVRYMVFHFLSGMVFFGMYAPEGQPAWLYSIIVNGSTGIINLIICVIVMVLLYKAARLIFIPKEETI